MIPAERHYVSVLTDSARWSHFKPRAGDVAVCTPPKSGTTWMQTICALLLSGDPGVEPGISTKSPWIDNRFREIDTILEGLDAQPGRRVVKSHTPLDGLPWHPELTYIAVYRHPLDVHFSMRKHVGNMTFDALDHYYPPDEGEGFGIYLDGADNGPDYDAPSLSGLLRHYRTVLDAARERGNIHVFHYSDLIRDLGGGMAAVARALGVSHTPELMAELVQTATFKNMKADPARFAPSGGQGVWKDEAAFFDSASSGKWQGRLSEAALARYEAVMDRALSEAERRWLENGRVSAAPDGG